MKSKQFTAALACALLLAALSALCGCQKQQPQQGNAPASQSAQSSGQGNGAAPDAPHVDPSKSPIADPASPLYGWEKFASAEGKFSVIFPNRPQEVQTNEQAGSGKIQLHAFASESDAHNVYSVTYYDVPRVTDPKMLLAKLEQAMVSNDNGKIASYHPLQVGNYPATEFEYVAGGKANYSGKVRLIAVGQRAYALSVLFITVNPPKQEESDAFFNSFTLQN